MPGAIHPIRTTCFATELMIYKIYEAGLNRLLIIAETQYTLLKLFFDAIAKYYFIVISVSLLVIIN